MKHTETVYAVIRRDSAGDHEWVDLQTVTHGEKTTRMVQREVDSARQKAWRDANPVVRVGKFELREVE